MSADSSTIIFAQDDNPACKNAFHFYLLCTLDFYGFNLWKADTLCRRDLWATMIFLQKDQKRGSPQTV
jgi:hypothetical protein